MPEKSDSDLNSNCVMIIDTIKKDINNSLKEIKENTGKLVETPKEETNKFLKKYRKV